MTAFIIAALAFVIAALLAMLGAASIKVNALQSEARITRAGQHAVCILTIQQAISGAHDAVLLRQLADKWDSVAEQGNLRVLAREQYSPGGPSMPAIWLRQQADIITERIDT